MGTYEIDVIKMISGAGLMVQFVLLMLLFFSVTSWAIIIVKFRYLRRAFKESDQFIDYFWKSRDLAGAFAKARLVTSRRCWSEVRTSTTRTRMLCLLAPSRAQLWRTTPAFWSAGLTGSSSST